MNSNILQIRSVLIFIATFIYASNFSYFLSSYLPPTRAWHVYLVLIIMSAVVHLISGKGLKVDRLKLRYISWFLLLMGLSLASLIIHGASATAVETLIRYMWVAICGCTLLVLVDSKRELAMAGRAVVAAVLFIGAVSILEFAISDFVMLEGMKLKTDLSVEDLRRSGGMFINANNNAYAIVIGTFVSVYFLPARYRLPLALFAGCAVLTTFSRSGMMMWGIAIVVTSLFGLYASLRTTFNLIPLVLVVALGYLLATGQARDVMELSVSDERVTAKMLERLSGNFLTQEDGSSVSRKQMVTEGLDTFVQDPLFGTGLGSSRQFGEYGDMGPHNMWLSFGIEFGLLGILLLLVLGAMFVMARNRVANLVGILYLVASLFSHTLLDDMFSAVLLPIGLVLLPLYQGFGLNKGRRRRRIR